MPPRQTRPGCGLLLAALISLTASAAANPAWWSDPATSIWSGGAPQNVENWAPVNLGQLKNVAEQARLHMDSRLAQAGGAGAAVTSMCQFTQADNYAPATVGQLKNVAKVFYDRMGQIGYNWQTGAFGSPSTPYPWTGTVNPENQAPCNIGQLKNVFTFDITPAFLAIDGDLDGMPSWWETFYGLNASVWNDPNHDSDLDQLSDLEEFQLSQLTGLAINPRGSHSLGEAWSDYEQSLILLGGYTEAEVAALRGTDQQVLKFPPQFGEYARGVQLWGAQHLIATGEGAGTWDPIVGDAVQWLGSASNEASFLDIPNSPEDNFANREGKLPAWPEYPVDAGLVSFSEYFPGSPSKAIGATYDVVDLLFEYNNLTGALNQKKIWLRPAQKVNFPVHRSFYILKKTRYAYTTVDMVGLPPAPPDELSFHTLTVPGSSTDTPGPPVASEPIAVMPSAIAVSKPRVSHQSSAHPFRFVFQAYPQALLGGAGGTPVATETQSLVYLPVHLNEDREQDEGTGGPNPMPDIDRNRAAVAATGWLTGDAGMYDRSFIKLSFDGSGLPEIPANETTLQVNIGTPAGTKVFLYDDQGMAILPEELLSTEQQPIAPIWWKLTSGLIYAEIGRLNTAATPIPGSPPLAPAGAATITVEANFLNPQAPVNPGEPVAKITLSKSVVLIPVKFKKLRETKNKANQIVVQARRDDPKDNVQTADADDNLYGTQRNLLYVSADPSDNKYHVSLECELGGFRDQFVCAAYSYSGGTKIAGTDKAFPASVDQPADMLIPATGLEQSGQDFVIKIAFDVNQNQLIDANEILFALTTSKSGSSGPPAPPMVRGFSMGAVSAAKSTILGQATGTGFTGWQPNIFGEYFVPNAQALLRLFYDGTVGGMMVNYQPTTTLGPASLNANGTPGDFSEWLTHHAGSNFTAHGVTSVQHYYWDPSTRISNLIANSSPLGQLKTNGTITAQMVSATDPTVENYKQATVPVGQTQTFPAGASGYDLQSVLAGLGAPHLSPAWVPKQTLLIGDQDGYAGAIPDDAFGTVGRSRFINGEYRFIVKKEARVQSTYVGMGDVIHENYTAVVVYLRVSGSSQDLYDFNHAGGGLGSPAAITQLSFGNGTYGRTNGIIFRATVDILKDYEMKEIRLP